MRERERERERDRESFGKGVILIATYVNIFIKFLRKLILPSKRPYVHACFYKIYSYTMETMVIIFLYEASTSFLR